MLSLFCHIGLAEQEGSGSVQFGYDEGIMRGNVAFQGRQATRQ